MFPGQWTKDCELWVVASELLAEAWRLILEPNSDPGKLIMEESLAIHSKHLLDLFFSRTCDKCWVLL